MQGKQHREEWIAARHHVDLGDCVHLELAVQSQQSLLLQVRALKMTQQETSSLLVQFVKSLVQLRKLMLMSSSLFLEEAQWQKRLLAIFMMQMRLVITIMPALLPPLGTAKRKTRHMVLRLPVLPRLCRGVHLPNHLMHVAPLPQLIQPQQFLRLLVHKAPSRPKTTWGYGETMGSGCDEQYGHLVAAGPRAGLEER
jgi:hypothetical protein